MRLDASTGNENSACRTGRHAPPGTSGGEPLPAIQLGLKLALLSRFKASYSE